MYVLSVYDASLDELLQQPDAKPAVAFTVGRLLVVGTLRSVYDLGQESTSEGIHRAHGLRIGPDEVRFGLGVITANGTFVTPPAESLAVTPEPIACELAGQPGQYELLNIS